MSTKTTFKRISLVAVAALGFGLVAAVPSSAAQTTAATITAAVTNATNTGASTAPIPGIHIHSLRHTYAYILESQGIHVTTAQLESVAVMAQTMAMLMAAEEGTN